jgi:ATP-dependent RNA helicase DeaD
MGTFTKLNLKKEILNTLSNLKFKTPFEVQEKVIPLALQGKNVVFTSRTGSGKTLAYLLGFLSKINKKQGTQMVVMVPTRELCIQVGKEIKKVCDLLDIKVGMLYGGRDVKGDYRTVNKKNQILIATPGRVIFQINEKQVRVGNVKYLVYDESDQMFAQGFYEDCVYIKQRVSKDTQIIFSSATITEKVKRFMENEIKEYEFLEIGDLIPKNIIQEKLFCRKNQKTTTVLAILQQKVFKKAIVFCNTKKKVQEFSDLLDENKISNKPLSGDLVQIERLNHLNLFKEGKIKVLVTTDVAARGLHIEKVDMVINYDVPRQEEFYIHRIGRTGRKDKKGYSLTIICKEDEERFEDLETLYNLKVEKIKN